jgi:DNA (cytosine-5)-methyltransferase 1
VLNGLDLFSGIGGLTLALAPWVKPVAYCENDRYAIAVLLSQLAKGNLPVAPVWDDIRTLKGDELRDIDIIYGGFPCQDVSVAGTRVGLYGLRTGLFREAIRLVRECKPQFVFLENVPGIRKYVPSVRQELEALGYDCRDGFLSAMEVGAKQKRNRWWLLANAKSERSSINGDGTKGREGEEQKIRCQEADRHHSPKPQGSWENRADRLFRDTYGISNGVDRLRAVGNAVVPMQAREAFKRLCGI